MILLSIAICSCSKNNKTSLDDNKEVFEPKPVDGIAPLFDEGLGYFNTNPSIIIDDQADLLTDEEEKKLYETMSLLSEYGKVVFLTVNTNPYGTADSYSRVYYTEKFSDNTDGVIFIIDMSTRYLYINSCGSLRTKLDSGKGRSITDNVFRYARNGQYFKCAQKAFEQAYTVVSGKQIFEPMRYIIYTCVG